MNRDLFLRDLRNELIVFNLDEQEEIIDDYLTYFEIKNDEGMSDEEIISELGPPKEIAQQFLAEFNIDSIEYEKRLQEIKQPPKQVGLFAFVVVFDVLVGFWLFALLVAFLAAMAVLGLVMLVVGPVIIISKYQTTIYEVLAVLSLVLGLALLLISGSILLIRLLITNAIKHINWLKTLV